MIIFQYIYYALVFRDEIYIWGLDFSEFAVPYNYFHIPLDL